MSKKKKDDSCEECEEHCEHSQCSASSDTQQNLQKKYMQFQMLKQQITALMEEKTKMDNAVTEMSMTIDAISKIKNIKEGEEMWSTLGSGAFVRSNILNKEKVLIDIGMGMYAKKDLDNAIEVLQNRLDEIIKVSGDITSTITKMDSEMRAVETEMQKLSEKIKE
ncbi:MAG: prefoldin subunit alpha [Candidatus Aenigmatarchaeota archaeon]